ncbi:MAG: histidine phosphatase family protein [Dehalococcoidia bacterium]
MRHAMSAVERGVASRLWGITDTAREDCVLLAHHLPEQLHGRVFSSEEPKARQTAEVIALRLGLEVVVDGRFGEVDRPTLWDEDYRATAARYLATGEGDGWEPREAVVRRFGAAIAEALEGATGDLVIVDHGLALSLYLASVAAIDIVPFWRALTFPDAWRWDPETGSLARVFEAGHAPPDA